MYDVERVRSYFPSLTEGETAGQARFDGPGGSQTPLVVADTMAATMTAGLANRGSVTAAERAADAVVGQARAAIADLGDVDPRGVVFGRSMTQLTMDLARTLGQGWGPGDEVVVTRLDHDANIRPWVIAAERAGATVRWLGFDPVTAELDDLEPLLSEHTRLVAVTASSNLFGTRPDVAAITRLARTAGATSYVDAVHLAPHALLDVAALGADFVACSPYKFFGPHLGALLTDPDLLEPLHPDKLLPSTQAVPERFELGTLPYELLAGTTAAVDFIADLAPTTGSRRERIAASMTALEAHESALLGRLLTGLVAMPGITVHGSPRRRTPTVLLTVDGVPGPLVHERLAASGVVAPAGSFYALEASRHAGLGDTGGVRVGLAAYTSSADVDRLLEGLADLSTAPSARSSVNSSS